MLYYDFMKFFSAGVTQRAFYRQKKYKKYKISSKVYALYLVV
jgi:hypothetical protein